MKSNYMTRAMVHPDPRFAVILGKMGYEAKVGSASDDLAALRTEYQNIVGKRAFHGWSANDLREKIEAAKSGQ
ncbi:hypothetical protein [Paenirhodobacter populi]|uniref:Uncharacterized protein n=1 Tax=Paenirhodobacter populi TaxID=2306993 RepID=A0A443IPK7_9RHOB|nr:hypothetical protein [Sinirhodobacter populi]RWR08498.1 hypothetical protein D2T33_15495 [Sinirhodobacter populi]